MPVALVIDGSVCCGNRHPLYLHCFLDLITKAIDYPPSALLWCLFNFCWLQMCLGVGGIDIFLCPRVKLGGTLLCVVWCGRRVKESKVSILVYTCLNLSLLVWTCLYLSELRRCTLSSVKESSVVASPLSCSPSPADSWCDVHEVPPWHLPTNKLRFFWRVVIDVLITGPLGAVVETSMKRQWKCF